MLNVIFYASCYGHFDGDFEKRFDILMEIEKRFDIFREISRNVLTFLERFQETL